MLFAFTAREILELKPRDKFKIESILAFGDRLLVGLSTGCLRIYRVNDSPDVRGNGRDDKSPSPPHSSSAPKPVELLRELERFSPRPIEQLAIIKEANILISLSNHIVSIHDLQSFTLVDQLSRTKNATTFAVTSDIVRDMATGIPEIRSRLCVAIRRKLLLWSWHESELSQDVVEITLSSSVRTLTWASATKILCGMNSGYVIVDVLSKDFEDIVGPGAIGGVAITETSRFGGVGSAGMGYMGLGGYVPKPLISRLGDGEILLAKDINSLFVDPDGKPIEKRQVPWQQAPDSIGYSYPYMLSLQTNGKGLLEIRNPDTLTLLQTVHLMNALQLHVPSPTVSLAHAGRGFHVISDRCIWRMVATDYGTQIDQLVDEHRHDEAISVLNMLEDALIVNKKERIREIQIRKARLLFGMRKYREAIELFTHLSAEALDQEMDPERIPALVVSLFPSIISGGSSEEVDEPVPSKDSITESGLPGSSPSTVESPIRTSTFGLFSKSHKKTISDATSVRSQRLADDLVIGDGANKKVKFGADGSLGGKDLANAVTELNGFLVDTRTRLQRFLDPRTGKLKASRAGVAARTNSEPYLQLEPLAMAKDQERQLQKTATLVDNTLFRSYMFASPSLAGSLFRIPNFCDPDVVSEKLTEKGRYNDLVDFFHGKNLHRAALNLLKRYGQAEKEDPDAPTLHGPQRTINYLQHLPPDMINLVFEFSEWPLRVNPELAMEIFVADTETAESLPRDSVFSFLRTVDLNLAVRYLEHVITQLDDQTPDFHNELVTFYIRRLRDHNEQDTNNWPQLMRDLIELLRSSRVYSLSKAFSLLPREDPRFWEAQAIVLCNMGQHKQALEIYVFKLKAYDKAEEYCNRVHLSRESPSQALVQNPQLSSVDHDQDSSSIYHTLLSLYLTPPATQTPNLSPALSLLAKHGSRLPASSTLKLIPASLPIAELESYFQGRVRSANSFVNESRVIAGLCKSEVISAQAALLLGDGLVDRRGGRNRRVFIGEERVCGVCHKRLGGSVVAVLTDNTVVHYGCLNRMGQRDGGLETSTKRGRRHS